MKYEKAKNQPGGKAWKQEVKNEHKQKINIKYGDLQVLKGTRMLGMVHEKESGWDFMKQVDSTKI